MPGFLGPTSKESLRFTQMNELGGRESSGCLMQTRSYIPHPPFLHKTQCYHT